MRQNPETHYQWALAIREKTLGSEHPDVAVSLNNLAVLYRVQGRSDEAKGLLERSLAILEKTLGPEHPSLAVVLDNYAQLLRKVNRVAEAEDMEKRAKTIRDRYVFCRK